LGNAFRHRPKIVRRRRARTAHANWHDREDAGTSRTKAETIGRQADMARDKMTAQEALQPQTAGMVRPIWRQRIALAVAGSCSQPLPSEHGADHPGRPGDT